MSNASDRGGDRRGNGNADGATNTGTNLFVTGIHPRLTEEDVMRLFAKYGEVEKCQIMLDPHTKESRGFGFVKMSTLEQADGAKEGLQGEAFEGRTLSIEKARRSRPRTPTPGKYFGPPKRGRYGLPLNFNMFDMMMYSQLTFQKMTSAVVPPGAAMAMIVVLLVEGVSTMTTTVAAVILPGTMTVTVATVITGLGTAVMIMVEVLLVESIAMLAVKIDMVVAVLEAARTGTAAAVAMTVVLPVSLMLTVTVIAATPVPQLRMRLLVGPRVAEVMQADMTMIVAAGTGDRRCHDELLTILVSGLYARWANF
jgi:hypothetical protein